MRALRHREIKEVTQGKWQSYDWSPSQGPLILAVTLCADFFITVSICLCPSSLRGWNPMGPEMCLTLLVLRLHLDCPLTPGSLSDELWVKQQSTGEPQYLVESDLDTGLFQIQPTVICQPSYPQPTLSPAAEGEQKMHPDITGRTQVKH